MEQFSNGAIWGRHHQLDDSLVGQLTRRHRSNSNKKLAPALRIGTSLTGQEADFGAVTIRRPSGVNRQTTCNHCKDI